MGHSLSTPIRDSNCFSSVQSLSRVWLRNPMDYSTPGLPVHHQLPEFTQTHVHWVGDAIQPSHQIAYFIPNTVSWDKNIYWQLSSNFKSTLDTILALCQYIPFSGFGTFFPHKSLECPWNTNFVPWKQETSLKPQYQMKFTGSSGNLFNSPHFNCTDST